MKRRRATCERECTQYENHNAGCSIHHVAAYLFAVAVLIAGGCTNERAADTKTQALAAAKLGPFMQEVPGTGFSFEMLPIGGDPGKGIEPFWISKCEITWEAFDAFVYPSSGAAAADSAEVDAITRPSKPYLPPDRGFGHEGFAAICMSHKNAEAFCDWLSGVSGRTFRLASEDEWEHACTAGSEGDYSFGSDLAQLDSHAWYATNAGGVPHEVGTKQPNAWGLHDMHGNVAEWVNGRDSVPVVKGGSYRDAAEKLAASFRQAELPAWNASDPQIPKSQWWLADAPFVGFRVVCEAKSGKAEKPKG